MENKPPAGYYRRMLPPGFSALRIARVDPDFPITGAHAASSEDSETLAVHLAKLDDPFGKFYADGLRAGTMRLIVLDLPERGTAPERVWAPGELFMRS